MPATWHIPPERCCRPDRGMSRTAQSVHGQRAKGISPRHAALSPCPLPDTRFCHVFVLPGADSSVQPRNSFFFPGKQPCTFMKLPCRASMSSKWSLPATNADIFHVPWTETTLRHMACLLISFRKASHTTDKKERCAVCIFSFLPEKRTNLSG